jgi:type VI secretion system secreted protein VgrG
MEQYDKDQETHVFNNILIQSGNAMITIDAKTEIVLHCGLSRLSMKQDGTISLTGENISISGNQQTMIGVAAQTVTCDNGKVTTSGAGITSTAVGVHEISGALVKIN